MRGARRLIALLVLVPIAMIGCQFTGALDEGPGGATEGTGAIRPLRGKLVSTARMPLTTSFAAVLNADAREEIAAEGLSLTPEGVGSRELPLRGRWVVIGNLTLKTDADGLFSLDVIPTGATTGQVFKQLDDATPESTFPTSALVREPGTPPLFRVPFVYKGPIGLNPGEQPPFVLTPTTTLGTPANPPFAPTACAECALVPGCLTSDPSRACCLDTDGALAARCAGKLGVVPATTALSADECVKARLFQFIGSTAWGFVFNDPRRPCVNEGPGVDCFGNHGFRNCQSVVADDITAGWDFTEGDKTRVIPAGSGTVTIGVHNNGWDHTTLVRILPDGTGGTLTFTPASGAAQTGTTVRLSHADRVNARHVPDLTLIYTPPATDPGASKIADVIEVLGDTTRVTLTAFLRAPPTPRR